jgi:hypothetical protein
MAGGMKGIQCLISHSRKSDYQHSIKTNYFIAHLVHWIYVIIGEKSNGKVQWLDDLPASAHPLNIGLDRKLWLLLEGPPVTQSSWTFGLWMFRW